MKCIVKNLEETQKIAYDFVKNLSAKKSNATIIGLYGDLGAGKTSFTQGVAKAFGVTDNVTSPTFVIEKIYELQNQKFSCLIHIDAYRIEKSEELLHLGWQEIISNPHNLILIEWPERVADIMPEHIHINFSHISENGREIEIAD
jgi:tRNA threonylcarbamoyladenosine biosynthesis protein TsaE